MIPKEATKAPLESSLASPPQPEEIKTTTAVLIRLLLSLTSPASPQFSIKGARVSPVSEAEEKGNNSHPPAWQASTVAAPSWGKEQGVTLNEIQNIYYYTGLDILITELRLF